MKKLNVKVMPKTVEVPEIVAKQIEKDIERGIEYNLTYSVYHNEWTYRINLPVQFEYED